MNEDLARALATTFPGRTIGDDDLEALPGGRSGATVLAFAIDGERFVLRKKAPGSIGNELACLRIASDSGVAPRVRHADEASGICIMERVDAKPTRAPETEVARALRRLHEGPPFPQGPTLPEMAAMVRSHVPEDVVATIAELAPALARRGRRAPCHRDLNPTNVLDVGGRVLFVDWETASEDDPFLDVAQVGAFMPDPEARDRFFASYLQRAPTSDERADMVVARVLALAFYAAACAVASIMAGKRPVFGDDAKPLARLFAEGPPSTEDMAASFYAAMRRERRH